MLTSTILREAIEEIQPPIEQLTLEDCETLYHLMFELFPYMRHAGIRLREQAIECNFADQGAHSRWEAIITFPLSVNWEVGRFEGREVVFTANLSCKALSGEEWIFKSLAAVLTRVTPTKQGFLSEPVLSLPSDKKDTFYCLASEVPLSVNTV